MNRSRRLSRIRFPDWIAIAIAALSLCLLLTHSARAQDAAGCRNPVEYQDKYIYCAAAPEEAAQSIRTISDFAANRDIPISAIQIETDEGEPDDIVKDRDISYAAGPSFNPSLNLPFDNEDARAQPLITIKERTAAQGQNVLSNLRVAIQKYRRQSFGCGLTNQIVSIGENEASEPFLCVQSGLLGETFTHRAERIQQKINQVATGNINVETLEIIPLSDIRTSMGISRYAELEGDQTDIDKQSAAIVSKSPELIRQEKIILIVTVLDAALHSQRTDIQTSPYQLANTYLNNLIRISRYAYQRKARPVTFNMAPFFWVSAPAPIKYPSARAVCQLEEDSNRREALKLFPILPAEEDYYNASFRADTISNRIEEFANSFNPLPFFPNTISLDDLAFTGSGKLNSQIFYTKHRNVSQLTSSSSKSAPSKSASQKAHSQKAHR